MNGWKLVGIQREQGGLIKDGGDKGLEFQYVRLLHTSCHAVMHEPKE